MAPERFQQKDLPKGNLGSVDDVFSGRQMGRRPKKQTQALIAKHRANVPLLERGLRKTVYLALPRSTWRISLLNSRMRR